MILYRCSSCRRLFAIDNSVQGNVYKVCCPNDHCNKTYIVHDNSVLGVEELSIPDVFHEIKKIIPNISSLDGEQLNTLIKELSKNDVIGNILITELINSLLRESPEPIVDESNFFVTCLEEKSYSLKPLFEKLDKWINQEYDKFREDNTSLVIANQCIHNLQKEKENLMEQIEYMKNEIHQLKNKLERYE